MVHKPLAPKNDDASKEIGETIHRLARGKISASDAADRIRESAKRGDDNAECAISFATEVGLDHKIVVVPDAAMIEEALKELGKNNPSEIYELLEAYIIHAARFLRNKAKEEGVDCKVVVDRFAEKPGTLEDFLYIRLGEYCISQCK